MGYVTVPKYAASGKYFPASKVNINLRIYASNSDFEREAPVKVPEAKPTEEEPKATSKPNNEAYTPEISNEMRKRLLREMQSQGNDPNFSRGPVLGNPILLISIVVAVLVLLGGKDILF